MPHKPTPVTFLTILLAAAIAGTLLWTRYPWPYDDPVVVLVEFHRPKLLRTIYWLYVTLLYTTPAIITSAIVAAFRILLPAPRARAITPKLPAYPAVTDRKTLSLVIGELHHPTRRVPVQRPTWLQLPEAGLNAGVMVIGATGSGKTSAALYPFADQVFGFAAADRDARVGGLVLDVKGDVNATIHDILTRYDRGEDHVDLRLGGTWRYNPLHNDLDAHSLASGLASLIAQLHGKGPDPFWSMAATNLVRFVIVLHRLLYGYVTFVDIYRCAIETTLLQKRLVEARKKYPWTMGGLKKVSEPEVHITNLQFHEHRSALAPFTFGRIDDQHMGARLTPELEKVARMLNLSIVRPGGPSDEDQRALFQLEAVERWHQHDWTNLHNKLRSSIVEGLSVFLSLFDLDPDVNRTFCPPASLYENPEANAREGRPLPSLRELIDAGKVVTLNLPLTSAPGLARVIGTLLKLDFQHAVLSRIADMGVDPHRTWRPTLCLIDEYHLVATAGADDPTGGDEKFLSLSRQARCIPILATQSLSSLRAALPGETWRALFQQLRTRIFLTLSDDFTARTASELCGRTEQVVRSYNVGESAQRAGVSWLDAKTAAAQATLTTGYSYSLQRQPTFEPRQFFELQNNEAIVLAYDGRRPHRPQYCYLRPHYLTTHTSYFTRLTQAARLSRHASQP